MAKSKNKEDSVRDLLIYQLSGHGAHIPFSTAVKDFPLTLAGKRFPGLAHTAWGLVFHLWIAQRDMVEYVRDPDHESLPYPSGYWPKEDAPKDAKEWERTIKSFDRDLESMKAMVRDPERDLFAPITGDSDWALLQQAVMMIDHNAYHIGQLVDLRMLMAAPVRDW
ncbi:MAG TPA: DinB family protein [Spirochaetia bacterium]|nr:DinB family protein [Spirochaetia bacterium]